MNKYLILFLICASVSLAAVTSTKYTVPDPNFIYKFDGLGRDHHGNIYLGTGWHEWQYDDADKNVQVSKFNFVTNRFDILGTAKQASEKWNNWITRSESGYPGAPFDAQGKIHTSFTEYKGKIYFGTHATCDMPTYDEDITQYPKFFRGGHLYAIDMNTDEIIDLNGPLKNVMAPGNGLMDVYPDYHHNGFYGVGYPTGRLFYHDLNTGVSRAIWQTPQGIPVRNAGYVTRNLIVDNDGRAYFSNNFRMIGYSYSAGDSVSIMFPAGHTGCATGHILATAHSVTRDSIYFVMQGCNYLFRLRVKAQQIDAIAPSGAPFLALRWDQNKIYYLKDASASDGRLHCYNITTGTTSSETVGGYGISGSSIWYATGNPVDKNGDIWVNSRSKINMILKFSLNSPCPICTTDFWEWGESPTSSRTPAQTAIKTGMSISPNPFRSSVKIIVQRMSYSVYRNAIFEIYNLKGQMVHRFLPRNTKYDIRSTSYKWHAQDRPPGIYIIRVSVGAETFTRKVTLLK